MRKAIERFLESIWKVLISLRFAVVIIASLAIVLATATIIESKYDTKTAQYLVYRSPWFFLVLAALGLNILAVAISRIPWKKKHTPFLMAHAGILMILIGSWVTYINGVDGTLRVSEGEVTSAVELEDHVLVFKRGEKLDSKPFPWMPAYASQNFKPMPFTDYGIQVDRMISDAEAKINFVEPAADAVVVDAKIKPAPAVQIKILGSPMGGAPEFWLWAGDAGWATQRLGLARFLVRTEGQKDLSLDGVANSDMKEARFDFVAMKNGDLRYEATSVRGEKKTGKIEFKKGEPTLINPDWRMPIQVQVKKFVPLALNQTEYTYAKPQAPGMTGSGMPQPAIQISLIKNPKSKLWLGLGDRAEFYDVDGTEISIGYFPKRVVLPFAIRLKEFVMKHNPGTTEAAGYSSHVQVVDNMQKDDAAINALPETEISMNEPLTHGGYTFYQASYIPDFPKVTTTILSVNYDPGRALKYWGSLLLVGGAILLYSLKFFTKRKSAA